MGEILLTVEKLKMVFSNRTASFSAVEDLSFSVSQGQTLGIVGESGSGKTMSSLSVMGLLPEKGRIAGGKIRFNGVDLLSASEKQMQGLRGNEISMIFQDPIMSLDQIFTIGSQIVEAILTHRGITKAAAKEKALKLLEEVGIPNPERVYHSYPFELSGGMCQRVMIAIALCCEPKLLFADEPTTALDVTVQAQIMDLLKKCQKAYNMGIVLITHDLGVVADTADRIVVMYAGKAMEYAAKDEIFNQPLHPYTMGLMKSIPHLDQKQDRLYSIEGMVPDMKTMPKGCRFSTRCPYVRDICHEKEPDEKEAGKDHLVRCHLTEEFLKGGRKIE